MVAADTERRERAALDLDRIDAVIFALDGVVADTAAVHAAAWKEVFDRLLRRLPAGEGPAPRPFDADADYRRHLDGHPRLDGAERFLASRGIALPRGDPADAPGLETASAVANLESAELLRRVADGGVRAVGSAIALAHELRARGVAIAVVAAGRDCVPVLRSAGALELFDAKVDGVDAEWLGLPGGPDPAVLLEAARRLGARADRTAVVQAAPAGVTAARRGGFALVIGVDRVGAGDALRTAGADAVVADLMEVRVEPVSGDGAWTLRYEGFDPAQEPLREALCTTGNGYFATRGAAPESRADGVHYPATYAAGVLNRLVTDIGGRSVENESVVNLPNWLPLTFRVDGGPWFGESEVELLQCEQELDLRRGMLTRRLRFRDAEGRHTALTQRRFTSMSDPHLAALQTTIRAEDWSGRVEVRSGIDAGVQNAGVARYRQLSSRHLCDVETASVDAQTIRLRARTTQSRVSVALSARTRLRGDDGGPLASGTVVREPDAIWLRAGHELEAGGALTVEKTVALFTSRDPGISDVALAADRAVLAVGRFEDLLGAHVIRWDHLWERVGLTLAGAERSTFIVNLHVFHLLQTISENSVDLDVGVPARGLHGEAYHGHVFWDELFVFPWLSVSLPELTRSLLRYRHRRLPEARRAAREAGHQGAMFPWQSGLEGREETQELHLNPRSGRWLPDNSRLQRHIGIAVAYNFWQYHHTTGDIQFLAFYGAEVLLEIARFWASVAEYDHARDRYVIRRVMGPDEYHDGYPGATEPGIDNNAYTNVMAAWVLCRALDVLRELPGQRLRAVWDELGLRREETDRWEDVSRRMFVPFHDGVISQFEGYERLEDFDWDGYRARYGDIQRLDRILEAEGDTPNRYKLSKQADVLMLFYLLSAEELGELLGRLGYRLEADTIPRTIDYYAHRTSHGSTLSRVVHSWVLARANRPGSYALFREALLSDVADTQHGTTSEGIHLGAMAGTVDLVQRGYGGLESRDDVLWINPSLPDEIAGLEFSLRWRRHWGITVSIGDGRLRVTVPPSDAPPIRMSHAGRLFELRGGETFEAPLRRPGT